VYGGSTAHLSSLLCLHVYQTNPAEKVAAAQLLSRGPATSSEAISKEIHQTTTSKYTKELRDQLLQNGKGMMLSESKLRK
jgi:hypothetical protein